jgi:MFS family permease
VMFWIALAAATSAGLVGVLGAETLWLLTILVGLFTGLSAALYPVAVAITNDRMESNRIVAASATLLLSYGIGSVIGPIVMAELVSQLGPRGLFLGNAGFLVLLAVITSYRISHTDDVAVEDQEHFVPAMPESSVVLTEMDPRNESFHESPEVVEMHEEELRQAG